MSPIKRTIPLMFLSILGLVMLIACGSSTPNKNAGVAFNSETGSHGAGWLPKKHKDAADADLNVCRECHGEELNGGIARVTCTECHIGGVDSVHPLNWRDKTTAPLGVLKHRWYVIQNNTVSCANQFCHGANLGGVAASGVDCRSCHSDNIPMRDNCNVCHDFPQTTAKHSHHISLQDVDCSVCHLGNHQGVMPHTGPVLMNFQSVYTAKSGASTSFNTASNTCSKVSCHGGQATPDWQSTAAFDVNNQCASCHSFGATEYNSYSSGEHDLHVNGENKPCTACHDTVKLAVNHFTALSTHQMEGPASATIKDALQYKEGSCTPSCHETRHW